MVVFPPPECITEMDIMSDWGTLPISCIVKLKACKFAFWLSLIGHTQREPIDLLAPTRVVNLTQCWMPCGQKEICTLINDILEVGVLVPTYSLCISPVWPMKKVDGSWRLPVDYQGLNKVVSPTTLAVPAMVATV